MKYFILFYCCFGLLSVVVAQQIPFLRTSIYSPHEQNPASFGTWNKLSVNATGQVNSFFEYTRQTNISSTCEFQHEFNRLSGAFGVGLSLSASDFLTYRSNAVMFNFNYQFYFEKFKLSIGAAPGIANLNADNNSWFNSDTSYASVISGNQSKFNFNTGIFLFSDKFFAGLGIAQVNQSVFNIQNTNFTLAKHYFANIGYRFGVSKNVQLFPSVVLVSDLYTRLLTCNFLVRFYKQGITVGTGYSIKTIVNFYAGYEYKNFGFLYSFGSWMDFDQVPAFYYHEARLTYRIRQKANCTTCEYF